MKAISFVVIIACIAFVANAGVLETEFLWQNPGWDPWQGTLEEALILAKVPSWAITPILNAYPDNFQISFVAKDSVKEDWMVFGKGKIRHNVRNTWNGQLKQNGIILGFVLKFGRVLEKTFIFVTDSSGTQKTFTKIRIRIWGWCGNISGTTWQETVVISKKAVAAPQALAQAPAPPKQEEKKAVKRKSPLSISFITEVSHESNNETPLITRRHEEVKVGTRLGLFLNGNARLETDVWVAARLHTVNNGFHHSWQLPLFQIQPKFSWKPTWWSYLLAADAVTFSTKRFSTNTWLILGQSHFAFLDKGWFQPMLQLGVSRTDSWPDYLSTREEYPTARSRYWEIKPRLQMANFNWGKLGFRLGLEACWADFAKTRLDSSLAMTHDLQYLSKSRPAYGGVFAQVNLPWECYLDASFRRDHIDADNYITTSVGSYWVFNDYDQWKLTVVFSKGFRWDLFR